MTNDVLTLDGSHGEGGGQILRTALSLSMITGRAVRLLNVRVGRPRAGLLPQHLSAVRASARISEAEVSGDQIGSTELMFTPRSPPMPDAYTFDVAEIAERGSAGSVTLLLHTLAVPLALAPGPSSLVLRGGTHVEWSPPFDHVTESFVPALRAAGMNLALELKHWGWFPVGQGEIVCRIEGRPASTGPQDGWPRPLELLARGPLRQISGRAVAANLPAHIPQRMADCARASLTDLGVPVDISALRVNAACPGAGIFLLARYDAAAAGFSAYGRLGKPSEEVAEEAVTALRQHHASGAAVEPHLADQLLLPLAVAAGPSVFTIARPTGHLLTNAWAISQFGVADIAVEDTTPCHVRVEPRPNRALSVDPH